MLVACGPAAQPSPAKPAESKPGEAAEPAEGKPAARTPAVELKVALPAKLTILDPHGAQSVDEVTHTTMQHVFDTLVSRDPASGNLLPRLATAWQTPDPTTWVFTLRKDAKFHDGTNVTSADVKASLERVITLKGPQAPLWAAVDTVETPDESTVQIKTKTPVGTLLANAVLVEIAPAAKVNTDGFFSKPIGSGPFKVVSWTPDADLRLEANPDYWGGPPGVKTLIFRHIPEVAASVTALETGEIDFAWRLPPDQLPALRRNADLKIEESPSYTYYFVWLNSSRDPFTDKRVRQAMAYALDVDTMVKDLLPGIGKRATAPIAENVFGHAPQTPYAYDPARAKQLLAEAGHPDGFETSVIWNPGSGPQDRELIQAMISYWNAVGVRVRSGELERAQWLDNLIKLNWDMDFQTNSVTTGDADFTLGRLYHSRANRNGYKNPELDRILDEAAASVDQNRRKELYAQANKIIWDDAAGIFPFELLANYVSRKRVDGFTPGPSPILSFSDVTVQR
jgi:peptide/nickel transport system substrate-binding protein